MASKIVAILQDMIFMVKIADAAKRAGVTVDFAKRADDLTPHVANALAIILDLNYVPPELIASLKAAPETRTIPLIGYVSHVESEVIREAKASGCDTIMARSSFVQKLGALMQGFAETP
jgi:DNA-binding LacI/PurR family transcriptional regulator